MSRSRSIALVGIGVALAIGGLALAIGERRDGNDPGAEAVASTAASVSAPAAKGSHASAFERLEERIGAKPGSSRRIGEFVLSGGRALRLYAVEGEKGALCLIDEIEEFGLGSTCVEPGFRTRRAAFSINSNGGPGRFGEMHLVGVAAPGIASMEIVLSDGSVAPVALNSQQAFVHESTAPELERDALPAALRLFGSSGRLVDTITIPALR